MEAFCQMSFVGKKAPHGLRTVQCNGVCVSSFARRSGGWTQRFNNLHTAFIFLFFNFIVEIS